MNAVALCAPLIAIATFRRNAELEQLLLSLKEELRGFPESAVLIVDNNQNPSAKLVVEPFQANSSQVRYEHEPQPGIVAARNRALGEFRSPFDCIVFVDDDETVVPGWIAGLVGYANEAAADVVTGPVITVIPDSAPRWIRTGGYLQRPFLATGTPLESAATNNTLLRYSFWRSAGEPRFDERFSMTGGSDSEFFSRLHKAGAKILYCREAQVHEGAPTTRLTMRWVVRRGVRNGIVSGRIFMLQGRSPIHVLVRGVAVMGKGVLGTMGNLLSGKGLRSGPVHTTLTGVGQIASSLGLRIEEYKRSPDDA